MTGRPQKPFVARIPKLVWAPMLVWAARDLGRHPFRTLATALTLFALAVLMGGIQLLQQAFVDTSAHLLAASPAIVVRKAGPTGWAPLPVESALAAAAQVPGALNPRARLWGLARISGQAVTVVALLKPFDKHGEGSAVPQASDLLPGTVIVGSGLAHLIEGDTLVFDQPPRQAYTIARYLPPDTAMAAHDTVLMHPDDARTLLGIPSGYASDLAIDVFHEEEIDALGRDLAKAFPWPVHISSRKVAQGRQSAAWGRRATLATTVLAPTLLALLVLGFAGAADGDHTRVQAGLLRALGWTGKDFLRLALWRWACLSVPSVGLGLAVAYVFSLSPGVGWLGPLLFGWTAPPPSFFLSSEGSALVLVQVATLVALPYLAIVVATGLRHTTDDPATLMEGEARP